MLVTIPRRYLQSHEVEEKIKVITHITQNFRNPFVCFPADFCGFCRPGLNEVFEITEPTEYHHGYLSEPKFFELGIYRIIGQFPGHTSHSITMQKFENNEWGDSFIIDGGWSDPGGIVIDWRGIRPITV